MQADDNHPSGDEPETATGEIARRCTLCREPIVAQFFTMRGLLLCPDCAASIVKRHEGRGRWRRAMAVGLATAAVFATLWFLVARATGRPLSALAVAAGLAVGLAVHQGSGGRGGLRYQIVAALLVYATFVARYVPPVFGGIADAIKNQHAERTAAKEKRDTDSATKPTHAPEQPRTGPAPEKTTPTAAPQAERNSSLATFNAYLVFTLVAWGLVLAAPFMPSTSGLLGAFLLAAGMALAWRLNRRVCVAGPFPPSN